MDYYPQLSGARRVDRAQCLMSARRFPAPWSVEEQPACFVVRDHNEQALAKLPGATRQVTVTDVCVSGRQSQIRQAAEF